MKLHARALCFEEALAPRASEYRLQMRLYASDTVCLHELWHFAVCRGAFSFASSHYEAPPIRVSYK